MSLNVRPILSALLRNRTGAVLVAMQIAIALAVLVNALYIVMQRIEKVGRPTGIDVPNIFVVSSASSRVIVGSTVGMRCASMVLPVPGGPESSKL